jgi:hypothetical protein
VNARPKSVSKDKNANDCPSSPSANYVVVAADKPSNYIVFVCKKNIDFFLGILLTKILVLTIKTYS